MKRISSVVSVLAVSFSGAAFAGQVSPSSPLDGTYGGDHVQLTLTNGSGALSFDCATGSFTGPLLVSANGTFAVAGQYTADRPFATPVTPTTSTPASRTRRAPAPISPPSRGRLCHHRTIFRHSCTLSVRITPLPVP